MDRNRESSSQESREIEGNLTERLREVLLNESEGDLLSVGIGTLQWLRALDLQVMGACRADERLKPLLKFNISNGFAEDRLLNQLSQHFEASEVGMLARCLCVPLVSIRVGKVNKQGSLMCPSTVRGHLNLTLLPSSNLRISFTGDDGITERVAIIMNNMESSEVPSIKEMSADSSGRSFYLALPGSQVLYFWCSEKSKLHGMELLKKMKDIVRRKPTLSELTGISESRLQSFATHLHTYLLTSSNATNSANLITSSLELPTMLPLASTDTHSAHPPLKSSHHLRASNSSKRFQQPPSHQYNLSPRPITFKGKCSIKEKPSQHRDNNNNANQCEDISINQLELPILSSLPSSTPSLLNFPPPPEIITSNSMFSPYYCWCPPYPPSLHLNNSIPLPPLSSLYSSAPSGSSQVASNLPFDIPKLPIVTLPTSQHISTFAPFMSDPIVHTPLIDICSSGQGYLVSAGATMSSAVPPLLPSFVNHPLIPNKESAVEKSARDTLRMLMASTPTFTCLKRPTKNISPSFFNNVDENSIASPGSNNESEGLHIVVHDSKPDAVTSISVIFCDRSDKSEVNKIAENFEEGCDSVDDN